MSSSNSDNQYPKILIISYPFNKNTGGGITMSNLFQGWPKDRLALASTANILAEADFSICDNYFQLGYNGKLHPFPLNVVLPRVYCGPIKIKDIKNYTVGGSGQGQGRFKNIYNILKNILEFIGLYNILYKVKVTAEFSEWMKNFDPDIIYSQLSTFTSIQFISEVADDLDKPVALHFMDDWIITLAKPGLLYFYWKKIIRTEFLKLVNRSAILMSIGEAMSEEYQKRYNRKFIPFHNPIDTNNWLPYSKNSWSTGDRFTILYAGRIGLGTKDSVIDVARVVNNLSQKTKDLLFEIQTPDIEQINGKVCFSDHVRQVKPIAYSELPKKFSGVDLLILPIDFDKKSINFLKYSFQTKISEYMISGTPVLVYAPQDTAVAKYAIQYGWAYVVTDRNDSVLGQAILELKSNLALRKNLGEKAKQFATVHEDSILVREKFRQVLNNKFV